MLEDLCPSDLRREFDRQVDTVLRKGYPALAGLSDEDFVRQVAPVRDLLRVLRPTPEVGRIPFALVVSHELVCRDRAMSRVENRGRHGETSMEPDDLTRFTPIPDLAVPCGPVYLVVDIETGRDTLNVTPDDALGVIVRQGRSPLTIDEGIAVVTHHPDVFSSKQYFSMLGSRCGDRRVTAIWCSSGHPRLGWCWAGNPHTWLGSASCGGRVGG
jgi:hypothetical protein